MFENEKKVSINNLVKTVWGSSPDSETYNDIGIGLPFYQGKAEFGEMYINSPTVFCTSPIRIAECGDILMSVRAPVGAVNIATQKCCIGRGLASIRSYTEKATQMFIFYALKYSERKIDRLSSGSTFKAIAKDGYAQIMLPDVEIELQNQFVTFAEQADKSGLVN